MGVSDGREQKGFNERIEGFLVGMRLFEIMMGLSLKTAGRARTEASADEKSMSEQSMIVSLVGHGESISMEGGSISVSGWREETAGVEGRETGGFWLRSEEVGTGVGPDCELEVGMGILARGGVVWESTAVGSFLLFTRVQS